MMNGLRAECYKLFHARIFWALILIAGFLSLAMTSLVYLDEKGVLIEQITVETGIEESLTGFTMLIESLVEPDAFFIFLFTALLSSFFIAGEYTNGTIKNIVSTGSKRMAIHVSKFIVIWVATILVLLTMVLTFTLFSGMYFGFGSFPTAEEWAVASKSFGLTCLIIGAYSGIATCISMVARSAAVAIFALLGFYLVFSTGIDMMAYRYTIFEDLLAYSVFDYMSNISLMDKGTTDFVGRLVSTAIATIVLFVGAGILLFQRREI